MSEKVAAETSRGQTNCLMTRLGSGSSTQQHSSTEEEGRRAKPLFSQDTAASSSHSRGERGCLPAVRCYCCTCMVEAGQPSPCWPLLVAVGPANDREPSQSP